MDIYIVARKVGEIWEPTAWVHQDLKSAESSRSNVTRLFPDREYFILTINLQSGTIIED